MGKIPRLRRRVRRRHLLVPARILPLAHSCPHALERGVEPFLGQRLREIICRIRLERRKRKPVVRRDEDDKRSGARLARPCHVQPRLDRHADVEKHDIRFVRRDRLACFLAIGTLGDDGNVGVALE